MSLNKQGVLRLTLLLLVLTGVGVGIYLVQHPAIFAPKASTEVTSSTSAPTAVIPNLAFVFFGESNSGGLASNLDATTDERAPTSSVQILNNLSFSFEDLQIGINNRLDHDKLAQNESHGLELQLANSVKAHAFPNNPQVYLVKTGQGASVVGMWLDFVNFPYWNKFLQRISAAKSLLPPKPVQWVVWYSLGINDHLGNPPAGIPRTSVEVFKSKTIDIIHNIKTQLPGAIIIMTQFQPQSTIAFPGFDTNFTDYNAAMAEIAAAEPNVYVVDTTGSALLPGSSNAAMHWDYAGFKTVGSRMIDITKTALQTVNTISAIPNPCVLNASQTCTSKLSWNFPGISDLKITVKENPGSVVSYQLATGSIDIPWVTANGATFEAYSGSTLLTSLFVRGTGSGSTSSPSPTPLASAANMSASPNPCNITSGETCSSTISWNFPAGSDVKIRIKEAPGSLFATGASGSQAAPWIRATGATFQAYVNGSLSQEIFVKGIGPSPSPTAAGKTGDINNDGNVNVLDLNQLIMDYPTRNLRSDVDHDNDLDIFDANLLISNLAF